MPSDFKDLITDIIDTNNNSNSSSSYNLFYLKFN